MNKSYVTIEYFGRWPCRTIHAKKKRWSISVLPHYSGYTRGAHEHC